MRSACYYSLDLETINFTPALHITKRGPAFDLSEDKNTETNTNANTNYAKQVKPATICERSGCIIA